MDIGWTILGFVLSIFFSIFCSVIVIFIFAKKHILTNISNDSSQLGNIMKNKILFYFNKWILIGTIILLNIAGGFLVYYTQNLKIVVGIIIILKSKEIMMSIIFVFNIIYLHFYKIKKIPTLEMTDEIDKVVAFVPIYKESFDQVNKTVDSILMSKCQSLLTVIVSDGQVDDGSTNYKSLLENTVCEKSYEYISWKNDNISCDVTFGYRKDKPIIFITKKVNVGKKDSIILMHDIFNYTRSNINDKTKILIDSINNDIVESFGFNKFDYMFCTDGDTIVDENAIICLIETIKSRGSLASCGIVNVDKQSSCNKDSFWNNIQNFQYLYGQYIRRTNEDLFNQVLCLPGCINMIKIDKSYIEVLEKYSTIPQDKFVESTVQFVGTDRRFTSSILYTIPNVKINQDIRAHCYTTPPRSINDYLSQRNRWTHNTFFNSMLNICSSNINIVIRFFCVIDVLRMIFVYARLFNTLYFIYILSVNYTQADFVNLIPYIVLMSYPFVCFFVYSLFNSHLRKCYITLLLYYPINKIFSTVMTLITFSLMLFNIGNFNWKINLKK